MELRSPGASEQRSKQGNEYINAQAVWSKQISAAEHRRVKSVGKHVGGWPDTMRRVRTVSTQSALAVLDLTQAAALKAFDAAAAAVAASAAAVAAAVAAATALDAAAATARHPSAVFDNPIIAVDPGVLFFFDVAPLYLVSASVYLFVPVCLSVWLCLFSLYLFYFSVSLFVSVRLLGLLLVCLLVYLPTCLCSSAFLSLYFFPALPFSFCLCHSLFV